MDFRQLARTLRRRWKLTVSLFLIGLFGAAAITLSITPSYRSTARIYVTATSVTNVDAYALGLYSEQRIASYADLAKDPDVLDRVIRKVGLDATPEELAGRVSATPVPSTVILQIAAVDESPETAREIARAEAAEVVRLVTKLEAPSDPDAETSPPVVARLAGDPTYDADPVSPKLGLNLVVGGLLGLLFGVTAAVLREILDTSVKTPEDASDAAGSAVMAVIPYDSTVSKRPLISDLGGSNERVDAFSVLRTNLQFADLDTKRQMLMVSSAMPEEGKTVTSINLAITLALTGRRVLIIDCDFRKPRVASLLGLENSVGLLTALVGHAPLDDCIQPHASGVDFLATGPQPPNPAEVLETQAMADLLDQVRASYDFVIIDAPPLLPVADPAIISSRVDGVLLVVRYGKVNVEAVERAADRVSTVGGQVVGVVLNMTPRRALSGYGYGYGYGYGATTPSSGGSAKDDKPKRSVRAGRRHADAR